MDSLARRRHTRRLDADVAGIAAAAALLRAGGLVAFPTETVYGLGAHALDPTAVHAIFVAKDRPADDPLIVHLSTPTQIEDLALANATARHLAECFWPGPLTLVLRRRPVVPAEVTAGRDTVAVRVPSHAVSRTLLEATGVPVAAPSANLFGRPSPTLAAHVLHDLDGRIDAILDGGPTSLGVESTIVDVSSNHPRLLRPGGLAAEDIEHALGMALLPPPWGEGGPQAAPGLLPSHYAPRTPLVLVVGPPAAARRVLYREVGRALAADQRVGVLLLDEDRAALPPGARIELMGTWSDPRSSASRLFAALRSLDAANLHLVLARELADPSVGLGRALSDRLRRAARRVVDSRD